MTVGCLPGLPPGFGEPGLASGGAGTSGPGVGVAGGGVGVSWTSSPGVAVGAVISVTDAIPADRPGKVTWSAGVPAGTSTVRVTDCPVTSVTTKVRGTAYAASGHPDDRSRRDNPHRSPVTTLPPHPCS